MNDTARVIFTWDCPRSCAKCCNKQDFVQNATRIEHIEDIADKYGRFVITGGEPLMYPRALEKLMEKLYDSRRSFYLQTAQFSLALGGFIHMFDGVSYSVHAEGWCHDDETNLAAMEDLLQSHPHLTNHLWVDKAMNDVLRVDVGETCWSKITVAPMLDDCPIGTNEDLYVLRSLVL